MVAGGGSFCSHCWHTSLYAPRISAFCLLMACWTRITICSHNTSEYWRYRNRMMLEGSQVVKHFFWNASQSNSFMLLASACPPTHLVLLLPGTQMPIGVFYTSASALTCLTAKCMHMFMAWNVQDKEMLNPKNNRAVRLCEYVWVLHRRAQDSRVFGCHRPLLYLTRFAWISAMLEVA